MMFPYRQVVRVKANQVTERIPVKLNGMDLFHD